MCPALGFSLWIILAILSSVFIYKTCCSGMYNHPPFLAVFFACLFIWPLIVAIPAAMSLNSYIENILDNTEINIRKKG